MFVRIRHACANFSVPELLICVKFYSGVDIDQCSIVKGLCYTHLNNLVVGSWSDVAFSGVTPSWSTGSSFESLDDWLSTGYRLVISLFHCSHISFGLEDSYTFSQHWAIEISEISIYHRIMSIRHPVQGKFSIYIHVHHAVITYPYMTNSRTSNLIRAVCI